MKSYDGRVFSRDHGSFTRKTHLLFPGQSSRTCPVEFPIGVAEEEGVVEEKQEVRLGIPFTWQNPE